MQGDAEQRHCAQIMFTRDVLVVVKIAQSLVCMHGTPPTSYLNALAMQPITVLAEVRHLEPH
jgi:hypothetical protein